MRIDLTHTPLIPEGLLWQLYHSSMAIRHEFVQMLDSITQKKEHDIHWIVTSPACRNPLTSPLLFRCSAIAMLVNNTDGCCDAVEEILTDSQALAEALRHIEVVKTNNIHIRFIPPCQPIKSVNSATRKVLKHQLKLYAALKLKRKKDILPSGPLTFIDCFWSGNYKGSDRYYGNMTDYLSNEDKKDIYYLPQIIGVGRGRILAAADQLKKEKRNLVIKEQYLTLGDYKYAYRFTQKALTLKIPKTTFKEIPIQGLIQEELHEGLNVRSIFNAALNIRFSKRLKDAGVKVKHLVSWFENQEVDRGLIHGFKNNYPHTPITGYVGFLPLTLYMGAIPTLGEERTGVLPTRIATTSPAADDSISDYFPDLRTRLVRAPSYRYSHIFTPKTQKPDGPYTVLLAMPLSVPLSRLIYKRILKSFDLFPKETEFRIKPHPTFNPDKLISKLPRQKRNQFKKVIGPLTEQLRKSDLVISSMSSCCLEALALDIPLITVGNSRGITITPVPENVPAEIHQLCFTQAEFENAVTELTSRIKPTTVFSSSALKKHYFTIPDKEKTLALLDFQNSESPLPKRGA